MTTLLAFAFVIGTCVLVHELGHYWVARRIGVAVEVFSIGFGPPLLSRTIGGTEWRIAAIPLGGFVKMKGEEPGSDRRDPDSFQAKPPLARMAVIAAGPLANILFAWFLCVATFAVVGIEEVAIHPVVGGAAEGSAAARAGFRRGDRILAVDGVPVSTYYEFTDALRGKAGTPVPVRIAREGGETTIVVVPAPVRYTGDDPVRAFRARGEAALFGAATVEGLVPYIAPVVGEPIPERPAERAGLRPGDRILRVGDEPVVDWSELAAAIRGSESDTIALLVERAGHTFAVAVRAESEVVQRPDGTLAYFRAIGIRPESRFRRLPVLRAAWDGAWQTFGIGTTIVVTVFRMATGEISLSKAMGPVGIAQASGETARRGELLYFLILISANLGFVNCVPFPLLDGGYLFLFLPYEIVRRRAPSPRAVEWISHAALATLLLFLFYITYHDIRRWMAG